jgi:rhodanese-related sulfurtransferase
MKNALLVVLTLSIIGFVWYFSNRTPEPMVQGMNQTATDNTVLKRISSADFAQRVTAGQSILLDIRTPDEFATGHIAKAQVIDFYATDFSAKLQELDKNTTYLIYCRSGSRSSKALETMRSLGFKSVYELDGGINNWNSDKRPICTNC